MIQPSYLKYEHFLKIVLRHKKENIQHLLNIVNKKVVNAIIEIVFNIVKGHVPLNQNQIRYFKKEKNILKALIKKSNSFNKKLTILHENPTILKRVLKIVL